MKVVSLPIITKVFHRQPCFQSWRATCGGSFSQKRLTRATSPPPALSAHRVRSNLYADSARSGVMPNSRIRPGRFAHRMEGEIHMSYKNVVVMYEMIVKESITTRKHRIQLDNRRSAHRMAAAAPRF